MTEQQTIAPVIPIAHHEWPVDRSKRVEIQGSVTAFTWANPHVMIALDVEANGTIEKWKVGGSSPQFMTTCGWDKKSLKPGDAVSQLKFFSTACRISVLPFVVVVTAGEAIRLDDHCGNVFRPRNDSQA